jgi:plastocyanin
MNFLSKKNLISLSSLLLVTLALLAVTVYAADSTSGAATNNITPNNVTIDVVANGMAFNTSTITVPAGANVIINFNNMDAGVPHNVAFYENQDAKKAIFVGDVINGPKMITYNFVAPATPGTYFFRCDVHPRSMVGDFIVK